MRELRRGVVQEYVIGLATDTDSCSASPLPKLNHRTTAAPPDPRRAGGGVPLYD